MKKTYSEKLLDPEWQKKRLYIMERDKFTCQRCFNTKETLNVHHHYYVSGREPWQYPDWALITYCRTCHEEAQSVANGHLGTYWECFMACLGPNENGMIEDLHAALCKLENENNLTKQELVLNAIIAIQHYHKTNRLSLIRDGGEVVPGPTCQSE